MSHRAFSLLLSELNLNEELEIILVNCSKISETLAKLNLKIPFKPEIASQRCSNTKDKRDKLNNSGNCRLKCSD